MMMMIMIIIIMIIISCTLVLSVSDPNATLPRYGSTDSNQIADYVTTLNDEIPWIATRWQNTQVHRIKSHGCADDIPV
jgi:predicted PurR-regulated permease PerM